MKKRLPVLWFLTAAAALTAIAWAGQGGWQPVAVKDVAAQQPTQPESFSKPESAALLADVLTGLRQGPAWQARVRLEAEFNSVLVLGSGSYAQRNEPGLEFRLDLRLRAGERESSLQLVRDPEWVWNFQQLPVQTLTRVHLPTVLPAAQRSAQPPAAALAGLGLEGLPGMLESAAVWFRFEQVTSYTDGETPGWVLRGTWRPDKLAQIMPDQREQILSGKPANQSKLPAHLPHEIHLYVRKHDLLVHRVDFRRSETAGLGLSTSGNRSIFRLDFYGIQEGELVDERQFRFDAGTLTPTDRTQQFLDKLNPPAAG